MWETILAFLMSPAGIAIITMLVGWIATTLHLNDFKVPILSPLLNLISAWVKSRNNPTPTPGPSPSPFGPLPIPLIPGSHPLIDLFIKGLSGFFADRLKLSTEHPQVLDLVAANVGLSPQAVAAKYPPLSVVKPSETETKV